MKKIKSSNKVEIKFDEQHLGVLISALETYSRLQSGQIKMAIDTVYDDRYISHQEGQYIENVIRSIAFPPNSKREYDGHGGFYDQYDNEYDEGGSIVKESEEWTRKKNHPHLDHANSSFGVGCEEMKQGTIAFEIKKIINQYLHYKNNEGYRNIMNVDGDGIIHSYSGIPKPEIVGFNPQKEFLIPKKYQEKIETLFCDKKYNELWQVVDKAFVKTPLPRGSSSKIIKNEKKMWCVVVKEPYKIQ